MFKCLQIMCVKYYELRYMFKKIAPAKLARLCFKASNSVKIRVIFGVWFESRKVDNKPNLQEK